MALKIENSRAEAVVRELAAFTGESLTEAVQKAAEERLARTKQSRAARRCLLERLRPLQESIAAERARNGDKRSAKELMDELYDENGLPI